MNDRSASGGKEGKMNLELSQEDLILMEFLLSKEESETHVAIHHCRNSDFKDHLKHYYEHVGELLARIRNETQVIQRS
jgi:hypothetical protein